MSEQDKRRSPRICFDGVAHVHARGRAIPAELMDLSLKGALVSLLDDTELGSGEDCTLVLVMEDSDIRIPMEAVVRRTEGAMAGVEFARMELDAMQHLRRLVELHMGREGDLEGTWLKPA